jgi:hypothetical protein
MSVKYQEHSVIKQMILSLIPFVNLWAAYRIEKLRLWVGFYIAEILFFGIWDYYLVTPETSDMGIWFFGIELILWALVMRHFTIKWNKLYAK